MKKILLFILILFLNTSCLAEWNSWQDRDKALFVASEVAILADWATTRYATRNWNNTTYHETNPILGQRPSTSFIDFYMMTLLLSNYYITDRLSDEIKPYYLTFRIAIHGYAAHRNMQINWHMRF